MSYNLFKYILHYVEASGSSEPPDSDSPRIQKIYEQICRVRANERLEVEYMQAWEEEAYARKDGINKGMSIGMKRRNEEIALKLLKKDVPDAEIMDITDISAEELQAIKEMSFATVEA